MATRRVIYATVLAMVYLAASLLSSLNILLCDHPHHDHHHTHHKTEAHHSHACSCCHAEMEFSTIANNLTLEDDGCCDHHHSLLDNSNTILVSQKQRSDLRLQILPTMLLAAHMPFVETSSYDISSIATPYYYGDEPWPLRAALIDNKSLRAPPALV